MKPQNRRKFPCGLLSVVTVCAVILATGLDQSAYAQRPSSSNKAGRGNVTSVDKKAEEAQDAFMRVSAELAREYEDLGELKKAQEVLENMLKLAPDLKPIEAKIKELEDQRMSLNENLVEVEADRGWVPARTSVEKGKTIRFLSEGECRFTIAQLVNPAGLAGDDVKTDLVTGIPLGALMGLIVDAKGKSGAPFLIGPKQEVTTSQAGQLFLKINLPPQTKANGKYRVQITGEILTSDSTTGR